MKEKARVYNVIILFALSLATFLYFSMGYRFFLHRGLFDEGLITYGATRILKGDIPYRDFWTLYAPGSFYLLAAIFKVFGTAIIIERISSISFHVLIVISFYFIMKGYVPKRFIFLALLLALAWLRKMLFYSYSYSYTVPVGTLFVLLSCLSLKHYFLIKKRIWLVVSGVFVGLVALFRQDFGFYAFISEYLVVFVYIFKNLNKDKERKVLAAFKESFFYVMGTFIIIFPVILYFSFNSGIFDLIQDIIIFPLTVYPKVRAIPFPRPSLNSVIFYFPILIFIIAGVAVSYDFFSRKIHQREQYLTMLFLFLGVTFLNYPRLRAQIRYLLPCELIAIILFVYLSCRAIQKISLKESIFYRFYIYSLVFIITMSLFIIPAILETKQYLILRKNSVISKLSLKRAYGCYDWDESIFSQEDAARFIQQRVGPKEYIFVGNIRHDRVVNNAIMFYFLSERHSATRYHELHPGLTNTQKIQKEIIDDLIKADVQYIILCSDPRHINMDEPNESSISSGVVDLDNFIRENYNIEKRFGSYVILRRI